MKSTKVLYSLFFILIICCTKKNKQDISYEKNSNYSADLVKNINLLLDKNDLINAKNEVKNLIAISQNKNDFYTGKAHALNGYIYLIQNQHDSAFYSFNLSNDYFFKLKDSSNIGKNLLNIAIIQSKLGDYSESDNTGIRALGFLKNDKDKSLLSNIYNSLAINSESMENRKEGVYWFNKAFESEVNEYSKILYQNNLAVSYAHLEEYKNSISLLNNLNISLKISKYPDLQSKVIDNLAYVRWKENPKVNVEKEFHKALEIRIQNDDKWGQIASNAHLAEYYTNKSSANALLYAQKMYAIATELNSPDDRLEALQKLILLETPENAKKYAIRYASLNDSLVTARNQAKDQFAKIRYDTEKNREENQSLKIKDVENQLRIQRQKNTTIIALSGIGFLTFVIIFLYFQQKNKRKREWLIATYESEVRMSKKVHDVVANDLHRFILHLQAILSSDHPEKEKLLSEIENIYQSSRDISHEFQALDKKDFNSEIRYLLSSYQSDSVKVIFNLLENEIWETVDELKKVEVFRVLQELMTNMSKHSQADFVVIEFKKVENKIKIIYRDNGKGFSEDQLMKKSGIANTENRMESIKGSIIFDSNPGNGLIVTITFPI